jgi:hypothetical protein
VVATVSPKTPQIAVAWTPRKRAGRPQIESLPVRRPGERDQARFAGDEVVGLHRIADGPDVGIARPHGFVDSDTASRAQFQPGVARQLRFGLHADGQDDYVGVKSGSTLGNNRGHATVNALKARYGVAEVHGNAFGDEMSAHILRHLAVESRHHLVAHLDDGYFQAAMGQILGHFQSDESAAHDDRLPGGRLVDPRADSAAVRNRAQGKDPGKIDARQRRPYGRCARSEHERVVRLLIEAARAEVLHLDSPRWTIDGEHFLLGPNLDVEAGAKQLGRGNQ